MNNVDRARQDGEVTKQLQLSPSSGIKMTDTEHAGLDLVKLPDPQPPKPH